MSEKRRAVAVRALRYLGFALFAGVLVWSISTTGWWGGATVPARTLAGVAGLFLIAALVLDRKGEKR